MERCAEGREGKEGSRECNTFFIMSLSLGSDVTGHFGIAEPGFLVNALRWMQTVPSTQVKYNCGFDKLGGNSAR